MQGQSTEGSERFGSHQSSLRFHRRLGDWCNKFNPLRIHPCGRVKSIDGDERRLRCCGPTLSGNVNVSRPHCRRFLSIDRVESIDRFRNCRWVLVFSEWHHAPIGNRKNDNMRRFASRESDGSFQKRDKFLAILFDRAATKLIVDADQQCDELIGSLQICPIHSCRKFIGCPSGFGNDCGLSQVYSIAAHSLGELDRPGLVRLDRLAAGVGIPERQKSMRLWLRRSWRAVAPNDYCRGQNHPHADSHSYHSIALIHRVTTG